MTSPAKAKYIIDPLKYDYPAMVIIQTFTNARYLAATITAQPR